LLGPIWLEIKLPALVDSVTGTPLSYTNATAHALIQEITFEIGAQEIDKQTGEWMEIWSNYTVPTDKREGWNTMIGKTSGASQGNSPSQLVNLYGPLSLYVPLRFWFCKNPGMALPLVALQYHPIRINLTLRPLNQLFFSQALTTPACVNLETKPASITDLMLWGDYVFLDVEERRRFVSSTHEYLIEQIQYTAPIPIAPGATSGSLALEFNHPVRELFWYVQRDIMSRYHEFFNYSSLGTFEVGSRKDILLEAVLQLDGFDRFQTRILFIIIIIVVVVVVLLVVLSSIIRTAAFALRVGFRHQYYYPLLFTTLPETDKKITAARSCVTLRVATEIMSSSDDTTPGTTTMLGQVIDGKAIADAIRSELALKLREEIISNAESTRIGSNASRES
jgi:hypothetical protein